METLTCKSCGKNMTKKGEKYVCDRCGAVYDNYLHLARRERDGGDVEKAKEYYAKAFAANQNSWEAYFFGCDYLPDTLVELIKGTEAPDERHEACAVIADYIGFTENGRAAELAKKLLAAFPDEKEAALKLYMHFYTELGDV